MVKAIEAGFPQAEIADAAYEQTRELEAHEREIVGVTRHADPNEELRIPLLEISRGAGAATPRPAGARPCRARRRSAPARA